MNFRYSASFPFASCHQTDKRGGYAFHPEDKMQAVLPPFRIARELSFVSFAHALSIRPSLTP